MFVSPDVWKWQLRRGGQIEESGGGTTGRKLESQEKRHPPSVLRAKTAFRQTGPGWWKLEMSASRGLYRTLRTVEHAALRDYDTHEKNQVLRF